MQSYEFVSSEFGGRDRELIPGHTAEVVTDPPSGFIEILIGPVKESRAGSLEDTAAFVLIGEIPAAEADLIFVQQIQPFGVESKSLAPLPEASHMPNSLTKTGRLFCAQVSKRLRRSSLWVPA